MSWNTKEIVANSIYNIFGCYFNDLLSRSLFKFVQPKIPTEFLHKNIHDLGCGDGYGTVKIKNIFQASDITGYEVVEKQVKRARRRGLKAQIIDLNQTIPQGEMASLWFTLHHLKDGQATLEKVVQNYDYIVIAETIKMWLDKIIEGGRPLPKNDWLKLFDQVLGNLGNYQTFQYKRVIFVFWQQRDQ